MEMIDNVLMITEDVFTAMIDGEPGGITLWDGTLPVLSNPLYACVDISGAIPARAMVGAEHATCVELARALMSMDPDEEVSTTDLVDAFGEVANVVGGNVKALIPDPGALSLPQVTATLPTTAAPDHQVNLSWRGHSINISLWTQFETEGDNR